MARLRATIMFEYEANPKDYQTYDPHEMAEIDQENLMKNPLVILGKELTVEVEPI